MNNFAASCVTVCITQFHKLQLLLSIDPKLGSTAVSWWCISSNRCSCNDWSLHESGILCIIATLYYIGFHGPVYTSSVRCPHLSLSAHVAST